MKTDTYNGSDIYCDLILSGKLKVKVVVETENILSFYHTKPSFKEHIVVIPKKHIDSLLTLELLERELILEIVDVVKRVSKMLVEKTGKARVATNMGEYQDSKHLHFHVFSD